MENGQLQGRRATHKLEISMLLVSFKEGMGICSQDIVIKSFRCCGISVKVDGTEDKEIHCIKDGGIARNYMENGQLQERRATHKLEISMLLVSGRVGGGS